MQSRHAKRHRATARVHTLGRDVQEGRHACIGNRYEVLTLWIFRGAWRARDNEHAGSSAISQEGNVNENCIHYDNWLRAKPRAYQAVP